MHPGVSTMSHPVPRPRTASRPRSHLSLAAKARNGGPMKDRRSPRAGTRNLEREWLAEAEGDQEDAPLPTDGGVPTLGKERS